MNMTLLLAAAAAATAPLPEFVALAFSNMQSHQATQCSFTRLMQDGEKTAFERFEPARGTWELLEIDGRAPSAAELEEYAEDKDQRAHRTLPSTLDLDGLAAPGSYRMVEDADSLAVYEFEPALDPDERKRMAGALLGTLVIDKNGPDVAYSEMTNTRSFSPALGVSVKRMYQKIEYQWLDDQEVFVIREVTAKMSGKAFGLKKISQDVTVTFGGFDCS